MIDIKVQEIQPNVLVSEKVLLENVLKQRQRTYADELFDSIIMPPWTNYVTMRDLEILYWAATAKSLAGNVDARRKIIRQTLEPRGFKRLTGGTNREVYTHYEDQSIVAKVGLDMVGLGDNQKEFNVQRVLFPWVSKMIQVCPSGVLGFAERVTPILSRDEYNAYLPMIYLMLTDLLGKYVLEDVGTDFFKNVGIRRGHGVVLLDYPYAYELDGNKLHCNNIMADGTICHGEIDYDAGMNYLVCTNCGKRYYASELRKRKDPNIEIKQGGKKPMLVKLVKGDKVLAGSYDSDSITRPDVQQKTEQVEAPTRIRAEIVKGNKVLNDTDNSSSEVSSTIITMPTIEQEEPTPVIENKTPVKEEPDKNVNPINELYSIMQDKPYLADAVRSIAMDIARHYVENMRDSVSETKPAEQPVPPKVEKEDPRVPTSQPDTPQQNWTTVPLPEDKSDVEPEEEEEEYPIEEEERDPDDRINDFPPNPWKGQPPKESSERRIKPYYIKPASSDDDDDETIAIASRKKGYYRRNRNNN